MKKFSAFIAFSLFLVSTDSLFLLQNHRITLRIRCSGHTIPPIWIYLLTCLPLIGETLISWFVSSDSSVAFNSRNKGHIRKKERPPNEKGNFKKKIEKFNQLKDE